MGAIPASSTASGPDVHVPVHYDHTRLAVEMIEEGLPPEFVTTIETGWWTTCLEILGLLAGSTTVANSVAMQSPAMMQMAMGHHLTFLLRATGVFCVVLASVGLVLTWTVN